MAGGELKISFQLSKLIIEAREGFKDGIPSKLHMREVQPVDEFVDPHPFTRRFAASLDHPPMWLVVLRRRRYAIEHYRKNHLKDCGCKDRPGYTLVYWVVYCRAELTDVTVPLKMSERLALRILENELHTMRNEVDRWKSSQSSQTR